MEKRNIWKNVKYPLEIHKDLRGRIVDVFYNDNIKHVSIVDSKKGALRGDHYHKKTVQHMLITKGSLEYWFKDLHSKKPAKYVVLKEGDLVTTPKEEVHALKMLERNQFVVFTSGLRGGKDYESDTYRVAPIMPYKKKN